jgi:beta-ureidopropionase
MPRKIKVVTTCMNGQLGPTAKDNLDRVLAMLDAACALSPDIVCLPEGFATAGVSLSLQEKAEPVPGPTTDACAQRARRHRTYVICPLLTRREQKFYNSAVILDRGGAVAGIYDKAQPVTSRWDLTVMESGVTPGGGARVFELDCGRIGIQICFDIEFPETWRELEEHGAELVFWPSAYDGGFPLRAYAYLHSYHVVSSVRTSHSRIINPLGEVLDHTDYHMPIAARTIDLDYMVCHTDFHFGMWEELLKAHGADVSLRSLGEEGKALVESNRQDLPLSELAEKFGLTPRREYINGHRLAYPHLRRGQAPKPQRPPFAGREPYTKITLEEWMKVRPARQ